jgi:hypothetical protein
MPIPDELLQRIRDNDPTLTILDLKNNQIGPAEAQALAIELQSNTAVTRLNLQNNQIGTLGAEALANLLQNNTTLTTIDLGDGNIGVEVQTSNNNIGRDGLQFLFNALESNTTVENFYFGSTQELEEIFLIEAINEITERNRKINLEISDIAFRKILKGSDEKFSPLQVRHVLHDSSSENCVEILENLLESVDDKDILDVLKKLQDLKEIGPMILSRASMMQEIDLPSLAKNELSNIGLRSLFRARRVTKEGIKDGLSSCKKNVRLHPISENLILGFVGVIDGIKNPTSATVDQPEEREIDPVDLQTPSATVNLSKERISAVPVHESSCDPRECCIIS